MSIVFLAYNRREQLAYSLVRVFEHLDYPRDRLEVIVVDNASVDGTAEMVAEQFPGVRVIRSSENVGMSAWNEGMTSARGQWRLALDDDCHIDGDALKTAVRAAEQHGADLVSFRVQSGEVPEFWFNDQYDTGLLTFWGCSAMFSRRAIEEEPFYDPNIFIWGNELELTMRYLDRGFRHLHLPEVSSLHMKGPNLGFDERGFRLNHRHFAYIAAKLLQPRDAVVALANVTLHVLMGAVTGDTRKLRGLPEIPRGVRCGLRVRAPVRAEVSRVYRKHTWHFASPIPQGRIPLGRQSSRAIARNQRPTSVWRNPRWFARRAKYYPRSSAVLEL